MQVVQGMGASEHATLAWGFRMNLLWSAFGLVFMVFSLREAQKQVARQSARRLSVRSGSSAGGRRGATSQLEVLVEEEGEEGEGEEDEEEEEEAETGAWTACALLAGPADAPPAHPPNPTHHQDPWMSWSTWAPSS